MKILEMTTGVLQLQMWKCSLSRPSEQHDALTEDRIKRNMRK